MGTGNCMSRLSGLFAGDVWLKDYMAANRRGCKQNGCEKHSQIVKKCTNAQHWQTLDHVS